MHRLAALLLCALAALVASATPAPEPKPWVTGWDKPVDPKGDCKFERDGERLTITVPGKGHELNLKEDVLDAPCLLRDVEGDFGLEVRVTGDRWVHNLPAVYQRAGILVMEETSSFLALTFRGEGGETRSKVQAEVRVCGADTRRNAFVFAPTGSPRRTMHLRVERRENNWRVRIKDEGKGWHELKWPLKGEVKLPPKLKVGVFAESTAEGEFKVTFDKFKLTRPGN